MVVNEILNELPSGWLKPMEQLIPVASAGPPPATPAPVSSATAPPPAAPSVVISPDKSLAAVVPSQPPAPPKGMPAPQPTPAITPLPGPVAQAGISPWWLLLGAWLLF